MRLLQLHIFRQGQSTALNQICNNIGMGSRTDPYEDYSVPHLLIVYDELFVTSMFNWQLNCLVSSWTWKQLLFL